MTLAAAELDAPSVDLVALFRESAVGDVLAELDRDLVGLAPVKARIREIAAQLLVERAKDIPLRRIGRPEELAALVTFLASPLAGYITGATIQCDGGAVRSPF